MGRSGEEVARDGYIWGYPLVVMHRTRALHCSRTPLGQLQHLDDLATPASRTVVAPNNDTLYSSGWYDLSAGDVTVDVPPTDRYWSVMVLDAYTNVGYISRRTHGTTGCSVTLTLDPESSPPHPAGDVLPVATPTAWVLVRSIVDGPSDLEAARVRQRSIVVTAPSGHPHLRTERIGFPNQVHAAGGAFFAELAAAIAIDPPAPWHPQPDPALAAMLGHLDDFDDGALARGVEMGEAIIAANPRASNTTRNGWGTNLAGSDFGDDVTARASTAKYRLAAHHPVENRSYVAQRAADGAALDGSRALRLRLAAGEPPCNGFWSLTVYGPDMFLVANELDRYAIGDRTAGLEREPDGALVITIGGPRPSEPSGWLPAPNGSYALGLRVYEGAADVVDATWFPAPLEPSDT